MDAGRLTLNLGLRLDHIRGSSPSATRRSTSRTQPGGRASGAAYDLTGRDPRVLRAFYGRYFEGTATQFFISATPGIQDYVADAAQSGRQSRSD